MFGQNGLFIVSILSGLTDVDAITLSLANNLNRGDIVVDSAWKTILLAALSNLLFKAAMVAFWGTRQLSKFIFIIFGAAILTGLLINWIWPVG
jgi:uncharacterized membrane protein (DUF4010 family)